MADVVDPNDVLPAETCVVRYALERQAATKGNDLYAVFEDGERWTFADTLAGVRSTAAGLQALGIGRGDHVMVMLPNSAIGIRTLFAAKYLGAVFVPINIAYRGAILEHVVRGTRAPHSPSSIRSWQNACCSCLTTR
jgi:crotonobetaine/carnitine-CoA ligase